MHMAYHINFNDTLYRALLKEVACHVQKASRFEASDLQPVCVAGRIASKLLNSMYMACKQKLLPAVSASFQSSQCMELPEVTRFF